MELERGLTTMLKSPQSPALQHVYSGSDDACPLWIGCGLSHGLWAQLCLTLCNPMHYIACQAPLPMEFSRQKYWSMLLFSTPGDLPNPGIKPSSFASPELAGGFFTTSTTWEA